MRMISGMELADDDVWGIVSGAVRDAPDVYTA